MTATSAPPEPYVSRVRLLPVPVTEPPYDDELGVVVTRGERRTADVGAGAGTGAGAAVQGTLPLDLDAVFEDQLHPVGVGAVVVADSLWLRYPGPESPRAPRELPRDGAAGPAGEGAAARPADPARATSQAHAADPARAISQAHAAGQTRAADPAASGPRPATGPGPATRTTATARPRPAAQAKTAAAVAGRPGAAAQGTAATAAARQGSGTRAKTAAAAGPGPATRAAAAPTAAAAGPGPAARAGKTPTTRTTTAADELPDPRRWTARLAQSALECLHGRRPLQQLVRWTAESVYRDLSRRAVALEEAPAVRPRIRALRVCRVTPGVAEASVVVQVGEVARAVAVRLEADDGRWLCTAFDIAEPSPARRGTRRGAARGAAPGAASNGARGGTKGQRAAQASSNASA